MQFYTPASTSAPAHISMSDIMNLKTVELNADDREAEAFMTKFLRQESC